MKDWIASQVLEGWIILSENDSIVKFLKNIEDNKLTREECLEYALRYKDMSES